MKGNDLKFNEEILLEVENIYNHIISLSESDSNGLFWRISSYNGNTKEYEYKIAENIYEGNAGILIFLMDYYKTINNPSILPVIKSSALWLAKYCESNKPTGYGFYTGRGGVSYALAKASRLLELPFLLEKAITFMDDCVENQIKDKSRINFDLLTGLSGIVISLLHLHSYSQKESLIDKIASVLNLFMDGFSYNHKNGISWNRSFRSINSLCGLSHGASGISWMLYEVAYYFSNEELKAFAKQCYLYEQSYYSSSRKNWPDLRRELYDTDLINESIERNKGKKESDMAPVFMSAWCHGAPGIGLTRLRMYELTKDNKFKEQAKIAVETTLKGFLSKVDRVNFSLCHGIGGNSYLPFLFAETGDLDLNYKNEIRSMIKTNVSKALEQKKQLGYYKSGLLRNSDLVDIGLFNGSAGIGYFMLFIGGLSVDMDILCPKILTKNNFRPSIKIDSLKNKLYENLYPITMLTIRELDNELYDNIISAKINFNSTQLKQDIKKNIKFFISKSKFSLLFLDAFAFENSRIKCEKLSNDDSFIYLKDLESKGKDYSVIDLNSKIELNKVCLLKKTSWNWNSGIITSGTNFTEVLKEKGIYWTLFKCVSGDIKEYQLNDFSTYVISVVKRGIKVTDLMNYFKTSLNVEENILMEQVRHFLKANILVLDE